MEAQQFLTALLAIIVIDLVLAGDNAIVIALAARALPAHLQKRAILWGAMGAIVVRSLMTLVVVWLLKIPGLLLAGGVLLVWIGYQLLRPVASDSANQHPAAATFWGAMRTIVVADAVMGLDNVLAVAGAAHGSYALVVTGLLISVPIVVWGSTLVLKLVERHPSVVYLGSGVLVWTAIKMIQGEPMIKPWAESNAWAAALLYLSVPAVLLMGFLKNHQKLDSRIHARLAEFFAQRPRHSSSQSLRSNRDFGFLTPQGERAMLKILIPTDGSANAMKALRHAVAEYQRHHELELHLLNVQPSLSRHAARFISRRTSKEWHQDQAEAAMAGAKKLLNTVGIPYQTHWSVGPRAEQICQMAQSLGVHHIIMGTARKNSFTRMLEDSVTNEVLETTPVPVEVVAGEAVSKWERWGLPAGVASMGGLMVMAID